MTSIEVVPWIFKKEWEFCRNKLFSDNIETRQKAVKHLRIWKIRCPNLPVGVECTLILMETHLQDLQLSKTENSQLNTINLELMYSMALTKFINFITDSHSSTRPTNTLQKLAKNLGIPSWIIDLRHQAAHGPSNPNLEVLREAVEFCLHWLYEKYWTDGGFKDCSGNSEESNFEDIEQFIQIYSIAKNNSFNGCEYLSDICSEERNKIHRYFSKSNNQEDDRFHNWTLRDLSKIMLKKLSKIIKKNPNKGEFLINLLFNDENFISSKAFNNEGELEQYHLHSWSEILSVLCTSCMCFHLLRNFIDITLDDMESSIRRKCAAIYLNDLLKNVLSWKFVSNKDSYITPSTKKKRKTNQIDIRRPALDNHEAATLLKLVLQKPSQFVSIYFKNLLKIQEPNLNKTKIDELMELVDIYAGRLKLDNSDELEEYSLKSILGDDYGNFLHKTTDVSLVSEEILLKSDSTTSYSSVNWSLTPLGILPWQDEFEHWQKIYQ